MLEIVICLDSSVQARPAALPLTLEKFTQFQRGDTELPLPVANESG
jgi:hypothetical protein